MKLYFLTFLLGLIVSYANGQIIQNNLSVYGNEWIDFDKTYFKIPVYEDGIYKISYNQLKDSGVDLNIVDGKDFQLFLYGKEVPVYTSIEGKFSTDDYIEFYGEKNRSELDYYLFRDKSDLLNPEYSLFNDTAAYFLTWDKSLLNNRYTTTEVSLNYNLPPVENSYIHEEILINHSHFIKPLRDQINHIYKSNFDIGEGFGSKLQVNNSFDLVTSNLVNSGIKPKLSVRYTTNLGHHEISFRLNEKPLKNIESNGFYCGTLELDLNQEDLSNNLKLTLDGKNSTDFKDRNSVSVIKLKYTREFKFMNKNFFKFDVDSNSLETYYEIQEFNTDGSSLVLYDLKNKTRFIPQVDSGKVKFVLPSSDSIRNLVLVNLEKSTKIVSKLEKIKFTDFLNNKDKNYIIISDKDRFIGSNNKNWVEEYSKYRTSKVGGGYKTIIVDVQELYNQFGYGINRHSIGINNFIIFLNDFFTNPEYVFIIGKGIEYSDIRTGTQLNKNKELFFVPTFGFPGSDNLLAARYNKNYPEIPIGRIAAKNDTQIENYLQKVKKHENYLQYSQTIKGKEWMKKVVHLVGGSSDIIGLINNYLDEMGQILNDSKYGANIKKFKKAGGDEHKSVSEKIIESINNGVGIITFFGHSGITGTDFNISNFKNNKYPIFFSLGCYSGNIHTTVNYAQSEEFVLDTVGVVAYVGTSGTGFTGSLAKLGKTIYDYTGNNYYGEGMGKIVQRAIKEHSKTNFSIGAITLNQQFTYHGDPAVALYKHLGPDYIIDLSTLRVDSNLISFTSDSLILKFDVVNLGSTVKDSLTVKISRVMPNGEEKESYYKIESIKSRKNVSINLPTLGLDGIGENCISIYIDPFNEISELPTPNAEENNSLVDTLGEFKYCFDIDDNLIKPIYPQQFGIINDVNIELQASTLNSFVKEQNYIFQIDTSELFSSLVMKEETVKSKGGKIKWKPSIQMSDNTVYYWRISSDGVTWENSSFVYLKDEKISRGWNQSHYFQYLKDDFDGMSFKERKLDFEKKRYNIRLVGKKYDPTNRKIFFVDGEGWGNVNPRIRPSICITAWGPENWLRNDSGHDFNSIQNSNNNDIQFVYDPRKKDSTVGIKGLLESIPDSMIVFIYTVLGDESQSLEPQNWIQDSISLGYNLFSILESFGANKIRLMESRGTVPYVLVLKKGRGVLQEEIGKDINSIFEIEQDVTINNKEGKLNSVIIGPSKKWYELNWQEETKGDSIELSYVKVHRLNKNLSEDVVIETLDKEYTLDLSNINANEYPFLKLEFYAKDKFKRTPPVLKFWRVLFEGYPDAIMLNSDLNYMKDTIEVDDTIKFMASIFNNSTIDMDSILVKYKIQNTMVNKEIIVYERYSPLKADSIIEIVFDYPAKNLIGSNDFTVTINANNEQEEINYFNNIGIKRFLVKAKTKNEDILINRNNVFVYPNPFADNFIIETNFQNNRNKINLLDINGKLVYFIKVSKGKQITNVGKQELNAGVYFLKINNDISTYVLKLIKLTE